MSWSLVKGQIIGNWVVDSYDTDSKYPYCFRCIFECYLNGSTWVLGVENPDDMYIEVCDICARSHLRLFNYEDRNVDAKRMADEHALLKHKLGKSYNMFVRLYSDYKKSARKRGYTFRLFPLEFYNLSQGICHYCDKVPAQRKEYRMLYNEEPFIYNGIDRKNNYVGYELSNAVSCCWACNKQKGTLPYEFFFELKRGRKP